MSVIEINGQEYKFLGVVLDEPFHLSYPFVFENNGQIYGAKHTLYKIRLYRCVVSMYWQLETVLIQQVSAADSMLIPVEIIGLITNICSAGSIEHVELHIFFADDFKTQD